MMWKIFCVGLCLKTLFKGIDSNEASGEICSMLLERAAKIFHDGSGITSLLLIVPTNASFCELPISDGLMRISSGISLEISTYDNPRGQEMTLVKQNAIAIVDPEVFEDQLNALINFPVDTNSIFILSHKSEQQMLTLTSRFPHSLVLLESSGRLMAYFRPSLFQDNLIGNILESGDEEEILAKLEKIKTNFHGHTVDAVGFPFAPYSLPDYENQINHGGFEIQIVLAIFKALNLKLSVRMPSDGQWWGNEDPPGSGNYTGLQGELQRGSAEIGWGNLFTTEERKRFMDFTHWYLVDPTCILMKRHSPKSGIEMLTFPFHWDVWMFSGVSLVAVFVFYLIHHEIMSSAAASYAHLIMYGVSIPLRESDKLSHQQLSTSLRTFHYFFILGCLVLSASYSGSLVSFLTVTVYPSMPETFEDVATEVVEKDLNVAVCCAVVEDTLTNSNMESFKTLSERSYLTTGWTEGWWKAVEGTDIYIYTKNTMELDRRNFANKVKYDSMHVVSECFLPLNVAIGLKKRSPLKEAINLKLKLLQEAGIVSKFISDGLDSTGSSADLRLFRPSEVKETAALDFDDTQGIFQVLLITLAVALLAFLFELLPPCLRKGASKSDDARNRAQRLRRRVYMSYKRKSVFNLAKERRSTINLLNKM